MFVNVLPQGCTVSFKMCSCVALKTLHLTTCAVIESVEIFIVVRKDTLQPAHAAAVAVSAIHSLHLNHCGKILFRLVFMFYTFGFVFYHFFFYNC